MCANMASCKQKRALESTDGSGEGGQRPSKRPAPITSNLQNSQINASPGHFTLDDIRKVFREESRELIDSRIQDALMVFIQQIDSLKNEIPKLVGEEFEQAIPKLKGSFESCIQNAIKGIIPQNDSSLKNAFQERDRRGMGHPIPGSFEPVTRAPSEGTQITDTRNMQLRFNSKLSLPIYTTIPLKSELERPIQVELIDANTGEVVTSGPESRAELDVVVLRGDFNNEDSNTWSVKKFEECIVNDRGRKHRLLNEKRKVKLKEGNGELRSLIFTDNSSWTPSKKFRIGVRVASGFCKGINVREAITEAFRVKEHRGGAYEKHYPPKADDDIWRLEEIAKTGEYCRKLNGAGINKVEDFMRILFADPEKLQKILKMKSKKKWIDLEDHAKTCKPDGKSYEYYDDPKDFGVVISNFCQFQGFITDGVYHSAEQLLDHPEARAGDLVKAASMNWKHVKVFDPANYTSSKLGKSLPTCPIELPTGQLPFVGPSDRHLPPLSFPTTQSSEIPWGSSVPVSDATAGLGNGNHDHRVGINPQSLTQSHITNSTASIGSEQDTNQWNQLGTSGHENVQSSVPHGSPTCPIELPTGQLPFVGPSDRHLPPLSFPKTQSSEIPWGSSVPVSDTTAGLGNGNHDHGVGINRQYSAQWHITNSTASIGSEQDTNRWNQQETSGHENVQSTVPYGSPTWPIELPTGQHPFVGPSDRHFPNTQSTVPHGSFTSGDVSLSEEIDSLLWNFTEGQSDPTIGFGDVVHNNSVGITPQSSMLPNNTNLSSITSEQDANPCNQRKTFGYDNVQFTEPLASLIPRHNTDLSSTIPEQDTTNPCNQQETFGNENVQCTDPYEPSWESLREL